MFIAEDMELVNYLRRKESVVSPTDLPSLWTMNRGLLAEVGHLNIFQNVAAVVLGSEIARKLVNGTQVPLVRPPDSFVHHS